MNLDTIMSTDFLPITLAILGVFLSFIKEINKLLENKNVVKIISLLKSKEAKKTKEVIEVKQNDKAELFKYLDELKKEYKPDLSGLLTYVDLTDKKIKIEYGEGEILEKFIAMIKDQLIDETLDIFKVNNGVFYPKVFEVKRTGFVTNLLSLSITNFYAFPFFNDQSELKGAVVLGFFTSNEVILSASEFNMIRQKLAGCSLQKT